MLSYEIKINASTIYRVEITRDDPLTTISKLNKYHYVLFEGYTIQIVGTVKHKYSDGMFKLMNKVNSEIHTRLEPESKKRIKETFNKILRSYTK